MDEAKRITIDLALEKFQGADKNVVKKFKALLRKTELAKPRAADVRALRVLVESTPDLWRVLGDLARVSIQTVINNSFPLGMQVSIQVGVEEIKKEYRYKDAPSMERMLIDQVIISWLQLQKMTMNYEMNMVREVPISVAALWEHRLSGGTARYLKAIETLTKIRKLRGAYDDDDADDQPRVIVIRKKLPFVKNESSDTSEAKRMLPPPAKARSDL